MQPYTARQGTMPAQVQVKNVVYQELLLEQQLIVRDAPNPQARSFQIL